MQIAVKEYGARRIVEHLGSAHNKTELAALLEVGRQKIAAEQGQGLLDLESLEPAAGRTGLASTTVESKRSGLLWDVLHGVYTRLGLRNATGGDRAFEQMVLTRLIEPTSKAQVPRVLGDLGLESVSVRTLFRSLCRCGQRGYREAISQALFDHVTASGGLALCLYDVTTLYFEAEREDDLRKVGYSKERRVAPPRSSSGCWSIVMVSLSRSAAGRATGPRPPRSSPSWRPSRPPTASRTSSSSPGAGMLSAANLTALDDARLRFIAWGPHHPGPRRPGGALPLARGRPRRRAGHRHHHPQEGLAERAGQESQGRAGVGPGHSPGFVEGGVVLH